MKHEWEVRAWVAAFLIFLSLSLIGVLDQIDEVGALLFIALPVLAWYARIIHLENKIEE